MPEGRLCWWKGRRLNSEGALIVKNAFFRGRRASLLEGGARYYVRLLCYRDLAEISVSQPCAGHQHRLGSDEENDARNVTANLPATRCTGAHVQGSLTVVPRERGGLLGQEHMARERTGPQSIRKSLGNTERGARQSKALL